MRSTNGNFKRRHRLRRKVAFCRQSRTYSHLHPQSRNQGRQNAARIAWSLTTLTNRLQRMMKKKARILSKSKKSGSVPTPKRKTVCPSLLWRLYLEHSCMEQKSCISLRLEMAQGRAVAKKMGQKASQARLALSSIQLSLMKRASVGTLLMKRTMRRHLKAHAPLMRILRSKSNKSRNEVFPSTAALAMKHRGCPPTPLPHRGLTLPCAPGMMMARR